MTGRKVFFYFPNEQHRGDFLGAHVGTFHKWSEWDGKAVGLIESTEGRIFMVHPEGVKFMEKYGERPKKRERRNLQAPIKNPKVHSQK